MRQSISKYNISLMRARILCLPLRYLVRDGSRYNGGNPNALAPQRAAFPLRLNSNPQFATILRKAVLRYCTVRSRKVKIPVETLPVSTLVKYLSIERN